MTATNGHDTGHGTSKAAVSQARPIVLLRYRPGLAPETARVVHLVPLPPEGTGAVSALCGALLRPQEYETLTPGQGMPCSGCVISHTHGDQVWLSVDGDVVALLLPSLLAAEVSAILTRRHCAPAVLVVHPYAPEHRVLLCGEPFGTALPWPLDIHRITGTLLLPPTVTPRGPLGWVHPPVPDSLRLCREIDVIAAVRVALRDPPPASGPLHF